MHRFFSKLLYACAIGLVCPSLSQAAEDCQAVPPEAFSHLGCAHPIEEYQSCQAQVPDDSTFLPLANYFKAQGVPPNHKVKILYIIPKYASPRPGYAQIIEEMAEIARDYYYEHTGHTFEFTDPLFELVESEYTEAEITSGAFERVGNPDPGQNLFGHFHKLIRERYSFEHHVEETLFLGITDIPHWSAWGGGGLGHIGGIEFGSFARTGRNVHLQAWVHELGHAFGLGHAENNAYCALSQGYTSFPFDSIMFWRVDSRPLEQKGLMPYEADWLIDPDHAGRSCLRMLGSRPHPSKYFTSLNACEATPDIDGDGIVGLNDLSALLVAWGPCEGGECGPADLNCDGFVGTDDLSLLLTAWGPVD